MLYQLYHPQLTITHQTISTISCHKPFINYLKMAIIWINWQNLWQNSLEMILLCLSMIILVSLSAGHDFYGLILGDESLNDSLSHTFSSEDSFECGLRHESVNLKLKALKECLKNKWSLPFPLTPAKDLRSCCYHLDSICLYEKVVSRGSAPTLCLYLFCSFRSLLTVKLNLHSKISSKKKLANWKPIVLRQAL